MKKFLKNIIATLLLALLGGMQTHAAEKAKDGLVAHFLGDKFTCRTWQQPVVVIADLTTEGEIDDNHSVYVFDQLARAGCVSRVGIVSIFGNGQTPTGGVHANLEERWQGLGLGDWLLYRGPDHSMISGRQTTADADRLRTLAEAIELASITTGKKVDIVELGPMTTSARLLAEGHLDPRHVGRILGVGGRTRGKDFQTGEGIVGRFAAFTDFNIRMDTKAVEYLLRHYAHKLTFVTYNTGLGSRLVPAHVVAETLPVLAEHAYQRQRNLQWLFGWPAIPSWDTWLAAFYIVGGEEGLGCTFTTSAMRTEELSGGVISDKRLLLGEPTGWRIKVCDELKE